MAHPGQKHRFVIKDADAVRRARRERCSCGRMRMSYADYDHLPEPQESSGDPEHEHEFELSDEWMEQLFECETHPPCGELTWRKIRHQKRRRRRLRTWLLPAVFALLGQPAARADVVIQQTTTEQSTLLAEPLESRELVHLKGDKLRIQRDGSEAYKIIRWDRGVSWEVDPSAGSYEEKDLAEIKRALTQAAQRLEDSGGVEKTFDVSRTGETKQISGHRCERVLVEGRGNARGLVMDMWIATGLEVPGDYFDMAASLGQGLPQLSEEMRELDGVPLIKTVRMDVGTFSSNRTVSIESIEERELSDELFEVPPGYVLSGAATAELPPDLPIPGPPRD